MSIDRIDTSRGYEPGNVHVIQPPGQHAQGRKSLDDLAERDDELGSWARDYLAGTSSRAA